jgi:DNA-binding response OmpR family regulator
MKKYKLVVIDDHLDTLEILKYNLDKEGYDVKKFSNAVDALKYINEENTDMVVTDWMLPEMDGLDLCTNLKQSPATNQIPIMMITCKNDEIDVVTALELGVEDYITKPFRIKEMLTRIKKIIKRKFTDTNTTALSSNNRETIIRGKLKMDLTSYKVFLDDKPMELTISEYKLLELLARKPGKVFTRNQLIESVNGNDYYATERSIDVQIVGLRKKLGAYKNAIETVRSVGYRFNEMIIANSIS